MVLIIFGNGVNCQVVLSNLTQGSYLSISFGVSGASVAFARLSRNMLTLALVNSGVSVL